LLCKDCLLLRKIFSLKFLEKVEKEGNNKIGSVYTSKLKAGKRRTYFFDVRQTKGEDYYITITESTKKLSGKGYERHKIFLYKEDFNRFQNGLNEVIDHIKDDLMPNFDYGQYERRQAEWEAQSNDSYQDNIEESSSSMEEEMNEEDVTW